MKTRILDMFATPFDPSVEEKDGRAAFDAERLRVLAERWIIENPSVALGAALTVGVLVGWLMKRK